MRLREILSAIPANRSAYSRAALIFAVAAERDKRQQRYHSHSRCRAEFCLSRSSLLQCVPDGPDAIPAQLVPGISRLPRIEFGGAVQFGKRIVGSFSAAPA